MKYVAAFHDKEVGVDVFAANTTLKALKKDIKQLKVWDIPADKKIYIYELKEVV